MDKEGLLLRFKEALGHMLSELHGWEYAETISQVYLYGSFPKGLATPDSDMDILVVLKEDVPADELRRLRSHITISGRRGGAIPPAGYYPEEGHIDDGIEIDMHFRRIEAFAQNNIYNNNVREDGIELWRNS